MYQMTAGSEPSFTERRCNPKVRAVFPDARSRIAHFFHGSLEWVGSPVEFLAQRVVHESYPDLGTAEIRLLIAAIERDVRAGVRLYHT
jgi:hypothetical protein